MKAILFLTHRMILFAVFQALIAAGFSWARAPNPWQASTAWWPLCAAAVSLVSLGLQRAALHRESRRWRDLLALEHGRIGRCALLALGFVILRPRLLPYRMLFHILIDLGAALSVPRM